jgi:hypothetical protein
VKFDQQERTALKRADDHAAAYLDSLVVIDAHDDETFWLTVTLPNDTRIVCVLPRPEIIAAIEHEG